MKKTKQLLYKRKDERGQLIELFKGKFVQANLLIMRRGGVWGNHYHQKTTEYFYLLSGELNVSFKQLKTKKLKTCLYKKGEFFIVKPNTIHTIKVRKLSRCLVLYSRQFSRKNPDIFRL
jgi:dTDP-4-dehydrorhamnose 3,5-epimerase